MQTFPKVGAQIPGKSFDDQGSHGQGFCFDTIVEMTQGTDKQSNRHKSEPAPVSRPDHPADPSTPAPENPDKAEREPEFGGPKGPEPTRYGDWEKNGRCTDF